MGDNKVKHVKYDIDRIESLGKINDEFMLVKIYAMATGKNRNFTYISKSDVEEAIPSAYYCPVVGHIRVYIDPDGVEHSYMGGHDFEITDDWEIKDTTRPYGVIIEGSEGWETINEHGTDVEYLTLNAFLWVGRYPELNDAFYSDKVLFGQSMEINIDNYRPLEEDSNYWEILGFKFSAFCLLGKADENSTNGHTDKNMEHVEPAFISASVIPYEFSLDEFKLEFSLLKDKIKEFVEASSDDTANKGGESMAEITIIDPVNSFEDNTEPVEPVAPTDPVADDNATDDVTVEPTDDGVGDNPTKDVADNASEEPPVEDTPDYEALYTETKNAFDGLKTEYENYKAEHSHDNASYDALVQYKDGREKADREQAETALFSRFVKTIGETEEYSALKDESAKYSIDELEMRLYAIVGKYAQATQTEDDKKPDVMKFNLGNTAVPENKSVDPYGNAREFYLGY